MVKIREKNFNLSLKKSVNLLLESQSAFFSHVSQNNSLFSLHHALSEIILATPTTISLNLGYCLECMESRRIIKTALHLRQHTTSNTLPKLALRLAIRLIAKYTN